MKFKNVIKNILIAILLLNLGSTVLMAKDSNILAYIDRGIKYYPKYVRKGLVKIGKASWYGKPFHRRLTASGERYNMYAMTAAHRTYAMNTILKVTNLDNRRSVRVRVNDRGPFYSSRDIDLSYGAAKKLGITRKGIGRVKIEVVSGNKRYRKHTHRKVRITKTKKSILKKVYKKNTIKKKVATKTYKVQLASFINYNNARSFQKSIKFKGLHIIKKYTPSLKKNIYKVLIGFQSEKKAKNFIKKENFKGAFLHL